MVPIFIDKNQSCTPLMDGTHEINKFRFQNNKKSMYLEIDYIKTDFINIQGMIYSTTRARWLYHCCETQHGVQCRL